MARAGKYSIGYQRSGRTKMAHESFQNLSMERAGIEQDDARLIQPLGNNGEGFSCRHGRSRDSGVGADGNKSPD
jgi:hypothetical protein